MGYDRVVDRFEEAKSASLTVDITCVQSHYRTRLDFHALSAFEKLPVAGFASMLAVFNDNAAA